MNFGKKMRKVVFFLFVFFYPIFSFAQETVAIKNPIKSETVTSLIKDVLEAALKIGIPVVTLAIIYCGFLFVSAQGNSEKLGDAKRALTYTLIGTAILFGSWAIAQLITETVRAL